MTQAYQQQSNSYMQMGFHLDGQCCKYLRIPTVWNEINQSWMGFIKTPLSNKLLYAEGKDSLELQNNFNKIISEAMENISIQDEVLSMFKPMEYWERNP